MKRASERASGRQVGRWEKAGERERSEQFVRIQDAGEINPAPARREIITLSLGATSIERASLATRFLNAREDAEYFFPLYETTSEDRSYSKRTTSIHDVPNSRPKLSFIRAIV